MTDLNEIRLPRLRVAIQANQVSFPSQVPLFVKHATPALQRYVIQLYFLQNWSCAKIAKRYGATRFYIWQIINEWKRHAVSLGYLQEIPAIEVFLRVPAPAIGASFPTPQNQQTAVRTVA